jgi:hypothetical protein
VKIWVRTHRLLLAGALIGVSLLYALIAAQSPDLASAIGVFYIAVVISIFVASEASRR